MQVPEASSVSLRAPTLLWPFLWSVHTLKDPCISSFPSSLRFPCGNTDPQTEAAPVPPLQQCAVPATLAQSPASVAAVEHKLCSMANRKNQVVVMFFTVNYCEFSKLLFISWWKSVLTMLADVDDSPLVSNYSN